MITASLKAAQALSCTMPCDGGVNLADDKTAILDNQQSSLLNLWHDGRSLTLRPALIKKLTHSYGRIVDYYPKNGAPILLNRTYCNGILQAEFYGIYIITETAILTFDGTSLARVPQTLSRNGSVWTPVYQNYDLSSCALVTANGSGSQATDLSGNVWDIRGGHFSLFYGKNVLTVGPELLLDPFSATATAAIITTTSDPYVPVIRDGCAPAGGGSAREARNLLSPAVSQLFTTDKDDAVYRLYDQNLDNAAVTAVYDGITGATLTFQFDITQASATAGGLTATLDRAAGTLTFSTALVDASAYKITDNLRVTYSKTIHGDAPIPRCTIAEWFGNDDGTGSGTRLFLSGNGRSPAAVYYSADSNPAYFPETCVLSVGDPASPVTAFGHLFDSLIVFKSSSVYSISLSGSNVTAAGVKAVDVTRGCDIPKSIQVANDRLVFASTTGGIMALSASLVRDERVVAPVSRNIGPALQAVPQSTLAGAVSIDTGTHYMLFAGNQVFVWDYTRSPLPKTASPENLRELVWYIWELPVSISGVLLFSGAPIAYDENGTLYAFDQNRAMDDAGWFDAWFYTKQVDFGAPLFNKCAHRCFVRFTCGGSVSLSVCMCTDTEESSTIALTGSDDMSLLRFEPGLSHSSFFTAGFRRAAGDPGSFGVKEILCTAKTCGTI